MRAVQRLGAKLSTDQYRDTPFIRLEEFPTKPGKLSWGLVQIGTETQDNTLVAPCRPRP